MNIGMLWYDGDHKKTLQERIESGVRYYVKKYGKMPEICLVNPKDGIVQVPNIKVRSYVSIPAGHMWIGQEEDDGS